MMQPMGMAWPPETNKPVGSTSRYPAYPPGNNKDGFPPYEPFVVSPVDGRVGLSRHCSGRCSDDEATRNGHRPDRTAHQTRKILPSPRGQREQNRQGHSVKLTKR
jgi:hypothetical protein